MKIIRRFYNDFFRPSQYDGYERILQAAKEAGYEFHTVQSFENATGSRMIILRKDIDTKDLKCMRALLELDKRYGARSSWYFRWNTMDIELIHEIALAGGEASYHYEEIATYCYKHHIRTKEEMMRFLEDIKDLFIKQYATFKSITGQPCLTIASHGDYVNRKFRYQNKELIDNRVRKACGIVREAYDNEHMSRISYRVADQVEMENFVQKAIDAIARGENVIELLMHPRQWNSPFLVNMIEEASRVWKQIYMRL